MRFTTADGPPPAWGVSVAVVNPMFVYYTAASSSRRKNALCDPRLCVTYDVDRLLLFAQSC
jgi:hypothetical protein